MKKIWHNEKEKEWDDVPSAVNKEELAKKIIDRNPFAKLPAKFVW